jgi:hypothetical protein
MKTEPPSVRIIPAKGAALFTTFVFAAILFVYFAATIHDVDTVIIDGKDAYRPSPQRFIWITLFLALPVLGLVTQILRLLPGSPFDFLEIGPKGLTVGKLFARRHRGWHEITRFSTGGFSLGKQPITWIRVESARPMRFRDRLCADQAVQQAPGADRGDRRLARSGSEILSYR